MTRRRLFDYYHGFCVYPNNVPQPWPGIYVLECLVNGKCYIGSSTNLANRFRNYTGGSRAMRSDIVEYGKSQFLLQPVLYTVNYSTYELAYLEWVVIREWKTIARGYNVRQSAAGPEGLKAAWQRGHSGRVAKLRTPQHSAKLSNSQSIRFADPKEGEKLSVSHKRRWASMNVAQRQAIGDKISAASTATPEARAKKATIKGKILINNGIKCVAISKNTPIPKGWRWGKLDKRMIDGVPHRLRDKIDVKGSVWITDGIINRRVPTDYSIPNGWRLGKTDRRSK